MKTKSEVLEEDSNELSELANFEANCQMLNSRQHTGFKRVQVELWLIFEDQTSSTTAKVVQITLITLIVLSTILILVQSELECKWIFGSAEGRSYDTLLPCNTSSAEMVSVAAGSESCSRVCRKRLEPMDPGGPFHFFVMDAVCIGCFTLEFLLRLVASPATIGLHAFATSFANWIDVHSHEPLPGHDSELSAAARSDDACCGSIPYGR